MARATGCTTIAPASDAGTPHLCAEPFCPNLVDGPGRCPDHKTTGSTSGTAGYGARSWRRVRDAYVRDHPWCEHPGCDAPALDVHHRDGRRPWDPGANRWGNLQALCRRHHRLLTEHPELADAGLTARPQGGVVIMGATTRRERGRAASRPEMARGGRGLPARFTGDRPGNDGA